MWRSPNKRQSYHRLVGSWIRKANYGNGGQPANDPAYAVDEFVEVRFYKAYVSLSSVLPHYEHTANPSNSKLSIRMDLTLLAGTHGAFPSRFINRPVEIRDTIPMIPPAAFLTRQRRVGGADLERSLACALTPIRTRRHLLTTNLDM